MSDTSNILVLVADETSGTLCANSEGTTRRLRCIDRVSPSNDSHTSRQARHMFACELMMALDRDAGLQNYDGVIIYSDDAMMQELSRIQTGLVSGLLMARIVGRPRAPGYLPGRPANELPHHGALS